MIWFSHQKCFQILPEVPCGAKLALIENNSLIFFHKFIGEEKKKVSLSAFYQSPWKLPIILSMGSDLMHNKGEWEVYIRTKSPTVFFQIAPSNTSPSSPPGNLPLNLGLNEQPSHPSVWSELSLIGQKFSASRKCYMLSPQRNMLGMQIAFPDGAGPFSLDAPLQITSNSDHYV